MSRRILVTIALSILVVLAMPPDGANAAPFTKQRETVRTTCFPPKLVAILNHIHKKTGVKPIVTSGHRGQSIKIGGSLHRSCKAADIRVPGVSVKRILQAARSAPNIGGIGTYRRKPGLVHVDIGPRRNWHH